MVYYGISQNLLALRSCYRLNVAHIKVFFVVGTVFSKIPLLGVSGAFWVSGVRGHLRAIVGTCWASGRLLGFRALLGFGAPAGLQGSSGLRGACWGSGHLLGFGAPAGLRGGGGVLRRPIFSSLFPPSAVIFVDSVDRRPLQ